MRTYHPPDRIMTMIQTLLFPLLIVLAMETKAANGQLTVASQPLFLDQQNRSEVCNLLTQNLCTLK